MEIAKERIIKKFARLVCLFLATAFVLPACGGKTASATEIRLKTPKELDVHTDLQHLYLTDGYDQIDKYAFGTEELSYDQGIDLDWSEVKGNRHYVLEIDENKNFSSPWVFTSTVNGYIVHNLKIATKYYWRVSAEQDGKEYKSKIGQFTTKGDAPRNMRIGGVTNVRDLGGWKTTGGKRVKQGLIYRTARLNVSGAASPTNDITADGIRVMTEQMKVKSEIDLRLTSNNEIGGLTASVLGETVHYYTCPMDPSGNYLLKNSAQVKQVFSYLADESNYPVFYHCNIGTDRTGLVSYLLLGLLGVSKEDTMRDYLYSNFGKIGGKRTTANITTNYGITVDSAKGATFQEKTIATLSAIGVTQSEMQAIQTIMLG